MQVLIADSDQSFREALRYHLWDCGHEVDLAADGRECLRVLREFEPAVLVIDRKLPSGGCEGVLAEIQSDRQMADIAVIIIGNELREQPPELKNSNTVAWISKSSQGGAVLEQISAAIAAERFIDVAYDDN